MSDHGDHEEVLVSEEVANFWAKYENATRMRLYYTKDERELKEKLLLALGYDDEDEKPVPCVAVQHSSRRSLFRVDVGRWRGLDIQYLKERYPEIYAECERTRATRRIRKADEDDE